MQLFFVKNLKGEIVAASAFAETGSRIINLLPATNEMGRKNGAMHFLLNEVIKTHQNTDKLFDFEGSSVASIARFYKSFGAQEELFSCFIKKTIAL